MFNSIAEVRIANKAIGNHWFDDDTIRMWGTQFETELIDHKYFVSSEPKWAMDGRVPKRKYTLREVQKDGSIKTIQPAQRLTLEDALELMPK